MPYKCILCRSYKHKLHSIPAKRGTGQKRENERNIRRRAQWYKAIGRKDNNTRAFVCSRHFIRGFPVNNDSDDPDYVPSQHLNPPKVKNSQDDMEQIVIELNAHQDSESHIHTLEELLADVDENASMIEDLKSIGTQNVKKEIPSLGTEIVKEEIISSDSESEKNETGLSMTPNRKTSKFDPNKSQSLQSKKSLEEPVSIMIREAMEARKFAYCPYSNFPVGAALLTNCYKLYSACNIENKVSSVGLCAERNVYGKALTEGRREFNTLVIVAGENKKSFTQPCGDCLQFMSEFGDVTLYLVRPNYGQVIVSKLSKLLPMEVKTESDGLIVD